MPSLTRRRDRDAAATVARQRLARLTEAIAAEQADRGGTVVPGTGPPRPSPETSVVVDPVVGARHRADPLATGRRVLAAVGDRLPAGAQQLRAERGVSGQHLTVVALVVAALIAVGAWWVVADRPGQSVAVAPVTSAAVEPTPTAAGAGAVPGETAAAPAAGATEVETSATAGGEVVVDVTGKVRKPGLVTLPAGSRVAEALGAAGGVRPGVDITALNLARPLVDGEQILVGVEAAPWPAEPTVPGTTVPGTVPVGAPVDVNTATLEQLDTLPGIGPVTGQAILDWRSANGAFTSVDELLEVDGIGDATLADIRVLVTV